MKLRTKIVYKNKNLEPISECEYELADYTDMVSLELKRIITDIEDLMYMENGNRSKDEWGEAEVIQFNKIKHKILDKAGEIQRLPETIFDAETSKSSALSFWSELFNRKE